MRIYIKNSILLAFVFQMLTGSSLTNGQDAITATPADMLAMLTSKTGDGRIRACNSIIKQYKMSTDEQKALLKEQYTPGITAILNAPAETKENWSGDSTPRNLAIKLSGELGITSAIPRLIELLRPIEGQHTSGSLDNPLAMRTTADGLRVAPAADALIQIGKVTVPFVKAAHDQVEPTLHDDKVLTHSDEHRYRLMQWSNTNYILRILSQAKNDN